MMINSFTGEYEFLSNFYPCKMHYCNIIFDSSEAAFQAYKCKDVSDRVKFQNLSAKEAKKLGRSIDLRDDWENIKISVMKEVVYAKFKQNFDLRCKLIDTGDMYLEEGNTWNDKFWGTCNGEGENILGIILMDVRNKFSMNHKKGNYDCRIFKMKI